MSDTPQRDVGNELYTANLISVYTNSTLLEKLNLAEQYELEKVILARLGFRDV